MLRFNRFCRTVAAAGATSMLILSSAAAEVKPSDVLKTYAAIALAGYQDALSTAETLKTQVDALLAHPTGETLAAARKAWIAARVPYQQTEVFRFGNTIVDDWEGKVNSWPLDEGLIDYVDPAYGTESAENELYTANVIANETLTIAGKQVDASKITKELISQTLHEAGKIEANVATGYHVIEFLLWGQDLNGTEAGSGNRPATDFDTANCTGGHCDRRGDYLRAATGLLIDDLSWMVGPVERRRRGAADATVRREGRYRGDLHRARFALLWRAGRRADEARPVAARSGGGA